ncbi:MAG: hypothetical protein R2911_40125 [Caldilineaceae bacterium]
MTTLYLVRFAVGEATEVTAHRDRFGSTTATATRRWIRFDNGVTTSLATAPGGRVAFRTARRGYRLLHGHSGQPEILEDNQQSIMGGWQVDSVAEEDLYRYEGTYTMHQHFIDCVRNAVSPA